MQEEIMRLRKANKQLGEKLIETTKEVMMLESQLEKVKRLVETYEDSLY